MENQVLQGNNAQWRLVKLIGEGDAGEVYRVESTRDGKAAILKRPRNSSFSPDIVRQASQIATEASLLNALASLELIPGGAYLRTVRIVDQSLPGNELTERYFIVVETASGFDLGALEKLIKSGFQERGIELNRYDEEARLYLHTLRNIRQTPRLLILRSLQGVLDLFAAIHTLPVGLVDATYQGLIWNDVKLDHIFWDPQQGCFTLIDWGNGQLLEHDGVTRDRLHSRLDDYRQFVEVMGKFVSDTDPELHATLDWPGFVSPNEANPQGMKALHERIDEQLQVELARLRENRLAEVGLVTALETGFEQAHRLDEIQTNIIACGELPDIPGTLRLYESWANSLAVQRKLPAFQKQCERIAALPASNRLKWKALQQVAAAAAEGHTLLEQDHPNASCFTEALQVGLKEDWYEALWLLCQGTTDDPDEKRWQALNKAVRWCIPDYNPGTLTPYEAAWRLFTSLESDTPRIEDRMRQAIASGNLAPSDKPDEWLRAYLEGVNRFKNDFLRNWTESNPTPPGAGLSYLEVENFCQEIAGLLPRLGINPSERMEELRMALGQPSAQAEIVLDAWRAKGFKTAQQGLRHLLFWDPDRRRVLEIDRILGAMPVVMDDLSYGPQRGEKLAEYAIRLEFHLRDLRARVGPARWIDSALAVFASLRNGEKPGDLLAANEGLSSEFPWLRRFERRATPPNPLSLAPHPGKGHKQKHTEVRQTHLGIGREVFLKEPMDTWAPEVRGSSARVFLGYLRDKSGSPKPAAVKVMRPGKADYALPLYIEETQILSILKDLPNIAHLLECGFLYLEDQDGEPEEDGFPAVDTLGGKALQYPVEIADEFLAAIEDRAAAGWLPYLALEPKNQDDCLLFACDEGYTRGAYLPVDQGLQITLKICDVLEVAHARDVVYRDHKIVHYYWNPRLKKLNVIDWNVAKWHPQGASEAEIRADLVQFGARTLHHILTGRPAPGALPAGPTRPQEIEMAPQTYSTAWTYDDYQRLPGEVMDILTRLLAGEYADVAALREDILIQAP